MNLNFMALSSCQQNRISIRDDVWLLRKHLLVFSATEHSPANIENIKRKDLRINIM